MRRGEEREAIQVVFVVDLDTLRESCCRIARDNQADQHAVHVHLIAVRRRASSHAAAVGERRIDCGVQRDHVAGRAIGDRNRAAQVDRVEDVHARALERRDGGRRNAKRLVDTESLGVAHQHRVQDIGAKVGHILHGAGVQVECLALGADEARVEERQGVATDLHVAAGTRQAGDDVRRVDDLGLLAQDLGVHAQQAVGGARHQLAVVRDAVGEDVRGRNFESDREDVEAGEDVLARRAARAGDAAEVVAVQVDEVEDALLVELVRVVELAGDDAAAVGQRVDERVDERLVVEADFAARRVARVVAGERAEVVDEAVGLRAVVVRQHVEVAAEHAHAARLVGVAAAAGGDARDGHRLGAAGELPQQFVAAAERVARARCRFRLQRVRELDAVDHARRQALADADVELVAVAVARAQALVALARLVQRVEVHDEVQLVMRAIGHPGVGVRVVGAGARSAPPAPARWLERLCADPARGEDGGDGQRPAGSLHVTLSFMWPPRRTVGAFSLAGRCDFLGGPRRSVRAVLRMRTFAADTPAVAGADATTPSPRRGRPRGRENPEGPQRVRQTTSSARKSLTLVYVGPVTTRSPSGLKKL